MSEPTHQAIVIGTGFAGLTAAVELAKRGVQTALVDDRYSCGLITNVGLLDTPGPYDGLAGADLTGGLLGEALEASADYQMGTVTALERDGGWRLPELDIAAPAVVLATGAQLRRLGVPGEEALTGLGVSQCAFCDGGLYTGQPVAVVGGGDAAFREALHLTIRHQMEVQEVIGKDGVDALRLTNRQSGQEEILAVAAVFVFIGLEPQSSLAPPDTSRGVGAAVQTNADRLTASPGLYAIGAVRAGYGGTLADAADDASAAAGAIADD